MNLDTYSIPYWLLPSLLLIPALLWMTLGVGLPYALAVLPRSDWRKPVTVVAVSLALGPAFTTTAMFFIGTFWRFSATNVLMASVVVAVIGILLATRNRSPREASDQPAPLTLFDYTLILLLIIAMIIRFWNTAYWPFTTYDEFWVYGYNAKLFMLRGVIPNTMGYYPQLVPLSYTFMQLMWGGINDHAARTIVPVFALTSVLMAYLLGTRLFNRRAGLLTAAIWALYPQHTAWSQFGDLEVPVTLYFTATVLFFALGWRKRNQRYIVLSGLMMGAALWTKPTAGALIESIVLIIAACAAYWVIKKQPLGAWLSTRDFSFPLLALCVAFPMGGMWYIRNVLYGLPPLVFPAGYWQRAAQRSGQEFGWLILIALALTLLLVLRREQTRLAMLSLISLIIGTIPSAFSYRLPTANEVRNLLVGELPASLQPTHLNLIEYGFIALGFVLLLWSARPFWLSLSRNIRSAVLIVTAFILPYFITWFWSYSYHPRLSFAIVPSLIVLLAVLLDQLPGTAILPESHSILRAIAASMVAIVLSLPGLFAGLTALEPALHGLLPDDHARYVSGNPALMNIVDYLSVRRDPNRYPAALNRPMRIIAPGEQRLPFFFPNDDIRIDDYPLWLDQIAETDYFIEGSVAQRLYHEQGLGYNQILASMTRFETFPGLYETDDGNFRYRLFHLDNAARFKEPAVKVRLDAQIGGFARLIGSDISALEQVAGQSVILTLYWQAIKPSDLDYSIFIHLWDSRESKLVGNWGGEPLAGAVRPDLPGGYVAVPYHTRLWQSGEYIIDQWQLVIPDAPKGTYELRVGLFDSLGGKRLPVTKNKDNLGDWIKLSDLTIN